jgi:hypothetical protein
MAAEAVGREEVDPEAAAADQVVDLARVGVAGPIAAEAYGKPARLLEVVVRAVAALGREAADLGPVAVAEDQE